MSPRSCIVPGCKSTGPGTGPTRISYFRFPPDTDLRNTWKINIKKTNWEPSASTTVCSLHFKENDFQTETRDKNVSRNPKSRPLQQRKLLPDAVPSIFSTFPSPKIKNQKVNQKCSNVKLMLKSLFYLNPRYLPIFNFTLF